MVKRTTSYIVNLNLSEQQRGVEGFFFELGKNESRKMWVYFSVKSTLTINRSKHG